DRSGERSALRAPRPRRPANGPSAERGARRADRARARAGARPRGLHLRRPARHAAPAARQPRPDGQHLRAGARHPAAGVLQDAERRLLPGRHRRHGPRRRLGAGGDGALHRLASQRLRVRLEP
ncbi:MAG: hypothetical protein AVDCRST_MAG40-529, partial [uncultured Gemmatimonadaceae bacterium]